MSIASCLDRMQQDAWISAASDLLSVCRRFSMRNPHMPYSRSHSHEYDPTSSGGKLPGPETIYNAGFPVPNMAPSSREIEPKIQEAVNAYRRDEKQKISKIAREFKVPYQRLRGRIHGNASRLNIQLANNTLNKHQEKAVKDWIFHLDDTQLAATPKQIRDYANAVLARGHRDPTKPPPQVSKMWAYRFIETKLPPQFKCRKQEPMDSKEISRWPELEQALYEWVLQEREQKTELSGNYTQESRTDVACCLSGEGGHNANFQ